MKHLKDLSLFAVAAAALMAFATSASATSVTTTTGGAAATPTIHAVNDSGHVRLANAIANIECQSTAEGKVESHGSGFSTGGSISSLSFTSCTNSWHLTIENVNGGFGVFTFEYTSGHNGTVTSTWTRVIATRLGITCEYETFLTPIGTLTGGNPATLDISASIPIVGGSPLCGSGSANGQGPTARHRRCTLRNSSAQSRC